MIFHLYTLPRIYLTDCPVCVKSPVWQVWGREELCEKRSVWAAAGLFSVSQLLWKTAKMNEIQQAFGVIVSHREARPLILKSSAEFKVSCVFGLGQV